MTKEQITQLMAEAGLKPPARGDFIFIHWDQIAMLLAHERERCAKVCETHAPTTTPTWVSYAAAIRARST
jgi:hypothetical protein